MKMKTLTSIIVFLAIPVFSLAYVNVADILSKADEMDDAPRIVNVDDSVLETLHSEVTDKHSEVIENVIAGVTYENQRYQDYVNNNKNPAGDKYVCKVECDVFFGGDEVDREVSVTVFANDHVEASERAKEATQERCWDINGSSPTWTDCDREW